MTPFAIRTYRPEDLPSVLRLTVEGFDGVSIDRDIERDFGPVAGRTWAERKSREVALECEAHPEGVFVAEAGGEVIGYVTTRLDAFSGIGRIPNLAVAAARRRMGVGTALIRHALGWMRGRGMAMAKIETLAQNERGQRLYPRLGFREVSRQIHYVLPLTDEPPAADGAEQ
ncbi:MAG TPA: GNAT family N-acetyltransferase [Gemmataceae bacterium]